MSILSSIGKTAKSATKKKFAYSYRSGTRAKPKNKKYAIRTRQTWGEAARDAGTDRTALAIMATGGVVGAGAGAHYGQKRYAANKKLAAYAKKHNIPREEAKKRIIAMRNKKKGK